MYFPTSTLLTLVLLASGQLSAARIYSPAHAVARADTPPDEVDIDNSNIIFAQSSPNSDPSGDIEVVPFGQDPQGPNFRKRKLVSSANGGYLQRCAFPAREDYDSSSFKSIMEDFVKKTYRNPNGNENKFRADVKLDDRPQSDRWRLRYCLDPTNVDSKFQEKPICSAATSKLNGTRTGGNTGSVSIAISSGSTRRHDIRTEHGSSISSATEVGGTFKVPEVFEAGAKETLTISGSFTKGDDTGTDTGIIVTDTIVENPKKDGPCYIALNVTSCSGLATLNIPSAFDGHVWYSFEDEIYVKNSTTGKYQGTGHYRIGVPVQMVVLPEFYQETIQLSDSIHGNSYGEYKVVGCA